MRHVWVLGLLAVALERPPVAQEGDDMREKMAALRKEKLIEDLKLSKSKREAFEKIYDEYLAAERQLSRERAEVFRKLVHMAALEDDVDEKTIGKTIDELYSADKKIESHHDAVVERLRKELESWQVARFIVFEEKFHVKVREMIWNLRKKGGRGHGFREWDLPPPPPDDQDEQ